jgi:tetratricopeptide (TPR) repeat protein
MSRPLTVERLRRRRRLLFWLTLPIALFAIFWAFKFISLAPTAQKAIDQFDDGYYIASENTSSSLLFLNVVEPYLPYFNRGDAFAADEYYGPATDDFEKALELAPMEKKCDVRLNLALAWERFGDIYTRLGYYQGAVLLYEASQAVMDDAGEECDPPPNQDELNESQDRVEDKKQDAEEQRDNQEQQPQESDGQSEQEQQLDELEQQQQEAAQEKADQEAGDRGEESGGYGTDKPW